MRKIDFAGMPTQNVNLTPELERFVKGQVAEGRFNSASEVHRAALAAMAREEEERRLRLERLRHEVQKGIDDREAGRVGRIEGDHGLDALLDASFERALRRLDLEGAEVLQ